MPKETDQEEQQPRVLVAAPIRLNEDGELPTEIAVHTVGKWRHPWFGELSMTRKKMNRMVKNHRALIAQPGAPLERQLHIDFEHKWNTGVAAAWVGDLRRNGDNLLFADIRWTDVGEEAMRGEHYMYISSEYYEDYTPHRLDGDYETDEETGKVKSVGPLITAAGLTNRPFITDLPAIMNSGDSAVVNINGERVNNKDEIDKDSRLVIALTDDDIDHEPPESPQPVVEADDMPNDNKKDDNDNQQQVDLSGYVRVEDFESLKTQNAEIVEQNKQLLTGHKAMRKQLHSAEVEDVIDDLKDKGAPAVVINAARTILSNCNPQAEKKVAMTIGDDKQQHNMFSATKFLLENFNGFEEQDEDSESLESPFDDDEDSDKQYRAGKEAAAAMHPKVDLENRNTDPSNVYGVKEN